MEKDQKVENERRDRRRFRVDAPVSMVIDGERFAGVTRDMSNHGLYFYMDSDRDLRCGQELGFTVELPPEFTLSIGCQIHCVGRVIRIDNTQPDFIGIAAEIVDYSITGAAPSSR